MYEVDNPGIGNKFDTDVLRRREINVAKLKVKKVKDLELANELLTAYVLNNLRIMKAKNPGDTYYEEYLKHTAREEAKFFDQYCLAIGQVLHAQPKRILEIGVRTGGQGGPFFECLDGFVQPAG